MPARYLQAKETTMKNRIPFLVLLYLIPTLSHGQNRVQLKWIIDPKDTIKYKTLIKEIDTNSANKFSVNLPDFFSKTLPNSKGENDISKIYSELRKATDNSNLLTAITQNKKGNLDIVLTMDDQKFRPPKSLDTSNAKEKEILKALAMMSGSVALRGEITKLGQIESFYVKNDQKNLLAILFELPGKEVQVGDTWALSTNLISLDQNFKCDSAFKRNIVTLESVKDSPNEQIATLTYNIEEYAIGDISSPLVKGGGKTSLHISVLATADFSITKGRWIKYSGLLSLFSSGIMTSESVKRLELIPN